MDINEIPRGQLSTIILTTLLDGDKYGLEIIDEIEKKTLGELVIKKPSLYSSLSRMEKQDLVSSYWKDSDIGGRRHYYRLTDYGRKQVLQWQNELLTSKTKVSLMLEQNQEKPKEKSTILQQENLFGFTNEESVNATTDEKKSEKAKASTDFIQYDLFSTNNFVSYPTEQKESVLSQEPMVFNVKAFEHGTEKSNIKNESQSTTKMESISPVQTEKKLPDENTQKITQIKTNFDFESEYQKYSKNTSSYADTVKQTIEENQPEEVGILNGQEFMETAFEKQDVQSLKEPKPLTNSFLDEEDNSPSQITMQSQEDDQKQEKHDDAVFITAKPAEDEMPKVKKIAPATFNHNLISPKYELNKTKIENENLNHQMEQKTVIQQEKLKEYFAQKSIVFRPYNKTLTKKEEQPITPPNNSYIAINKYNMFKSLALFLILTAESLGLLFGLKAFELFALSSLWLYLAMIIGGIVFFLYNLTIFLKNKHKKIAKQSLFQNPLWYKLVFISIGLILVYAIHLLAGMNEFNMTNYLTTLLIPCFLSLDYIGLHVANVIVFKDKE